jgi:hypothetical protein
MITPTSLNVEEELYDKPHQSANADSFSDREAEIEEKR